MHLLAAIVAVLAGGHSEFRPPDISGFVHVDAIFFDQSPLSAAIIDDVQDVANFRRARVILRGDIGEEVDYRFGLDFGGPGRPSFLDTWFDVPLWGVREEGDALVLRVGRFKVPQGMAALESSSDLIFLERATPTTFAPFRQSGVRLLGTYGERQGTVSAAGYRYAADVFGDVAGDPGYGVAVRSTLALGDDEPTGDPLMHVGVSLSSQTPDDGNLRFTATPGVGFNELDFRTDSSPVPAFIDTGNFPADRFNLYGLESAVAMGPLLLRTEGFAGTIDLEEDGGGGVTFAGLYAEAACVLIGPPRRYDRQQGLFGGLTPGESGHALEFAVRYDTVDLTDGPIAGGTLDNWTLGANWVPLERLKFQANYVFSDATRDRRSAGDTRVLAFRAQFVF